MKFTVIHGDYIDGNLQLVYHTLVVPVAALISVKRADLSEDTATK